MLSQSDAVHKSGRFAAVAAYDENMMKAANAVIGLRSEKPARSTGFYQKRKIKWREFPK